MALLPQPGDCPRNHYMTGFWFSTPLSETCSREVDAFLGSGEPPILVTLGSMSVKTKVPLEQLLEAALRGTNERFLVAKGWQDWEAGIFEGNERILFAGDLPYRSLLPRVKAVVHHGGIGTIAECLHAGKPMFICPVLHPVGDHMFWGRKAEKMGCGVPPVPLKKLEPDAFAQHVVILAGGKPLHDRAAMIARSIRGENGVGNAADLLEKIASV